MNQQLNELHLRRGRLLERIASQRASLSDEVQPVRAALDRTDRVLERVRDGVEYLRAHPAVIAALGLAAVFIVKPGRVWRWSSRAFTVWQTWRVMRDRFVVQ
jgi:hypothetical protein